MEEASLGYSPQRLGSLREASAERGAKTITPGKVSLYGNCVCGFGPITPPQKAVSKLDPSHTYEMCLDLWPSLPYFGWKYKGKYHGF